MIYQLVDRRIREPEKDREKDEEDYERREKGQIRVWATVRL
jgi:hypothetical protein